MSWTDAVIGAVAVLLVLNLLAALAFFASRRAAGGWLLVLLLTSTSGAAVAALVASIDRGTERFLDIGLVFVGLAALTAAVRAAAGPRLR